MTDAELRAIYPDAKSIAERLARWKNTREAGREAHSQGCALNRVMGVPNPGSGKNRKWNKKRDTVPGDNPEHMKRTKSRLPTPAVNSIFNVSDLKATLRADARSHIGRLGRPVGSDE